MISSTAIQTIIVALLFMALDIITGLIGAFKKHEFDSTIMKDGLFSKCGSLFAIIFGMLVDFAEQTIDLGFNVSFAIPICVYTILMNGGSIVENIDKISPQLLPTGLKKYFAKIDNSEESEE